MNNMVLELWQLKLGPRTATQQMAGSVKFGCASCGLYTKSHTNLGSTWRATLRMDRAFGDPNAQRSYRSHSFGPHSRYYFNTWIPRALSSLYEVLYCMMGSIVGAAFLWAFVF